MMSRQTTMAQNKGALFTPSYMHGTCLDISRSSYIAISDLGLQISQYMGSKVYLFSTFMEKFVCVCVEVLRPSQPSGVMSSAVSLPNHTFTGQA